MTLEIRNLTLSIGRRDLLRDLSLDVAAEGITVLIGASGCGKTALLKWLAGILPAGIAAKGGFGLRGQPAAAARAAIGYQPQQDALFPWLTIAENAALGLRVAGLSRAAARAKVLPLFQPFGLAGTEAALPAALSGGMRQRAAFLRSMVQDHRYILLDEPFSALDAVTRLRMQAWLRARLAAQPRGILLVTHDLHEATSLADRILVMGGQPGRILDDLALDLPRGQRHEAAMAGLRQHLKTLLLKENPG